MESFAGVSSVASEMGVVSVEYSRHTDALTVVSGTVVVGVVDIGLVVETCMKLGTKVPAAKSARASALAKPTSIARSTLL
jgi:hypothetical protein